MAETAMYQKKYVEVGVRFALDGTMLPRLIAWEDGHQYTIDRVVNIQSAPALKVGGQGDRYTVLIGGQQRELFFEHSPDYGDPKLGRWFVCVPVRG